MNEFFANGAPPEDFGFDDVELVVVFLADFLPVVGVGEDLIIDEDLLDEDSEVFGKTVSLGAAGSCSV